MGTLFFGESKGAIRSSIALDNQEKILTMPVEVKYSPRALNEIIVEKLVYVDRDVIREVIKEVKVEVPVNVYKEKIVEVIKEVPVEVIKEVVKIEEKLVNVYKEIAGAPAVLSGKQFFYYTAPLFILGTALGILLGTLI